MTEKEPRKRIYKVIVLGDGCVGKTAITVRLCKGEFQAEYKMTIGVSFGVKDFENNTTLQIWDIAGQERFGAFRKNYYSGAFGAILVYDVTNRLTFLDLPNWIAEMQQIVGYIPCVVVGNKVDLPESAQFDKKVEYDEGMEFADLINAPFLETSAKSNHNIENMFTSLIEKIGQGQMSLPLNLDSYDTVDFGFKQLGSLIDEGVSSKIFDGLLKLKQAIFKKNPYSVVLGNLNQWIEFIPHVRLNEDIRGRLVQSRKAWSLYYNRSLQEGQTVTAKI